MVQVQQQQQPQSSSKKARTVPSKASSRAGYASLVVFVVLLLAWVAGFSSRLFAVIRFESIIHEFDPWSVNSRLFLVKFVAHVGIAGSTTEPLRTW